MGFMGFYGLLWGPMGLTGLYGFYRIQWGPMGSYRVLWGPYGVLTDHGL